VGGGAVTVTDAVAVAGVVPDAPVAVSANVVVPTTFSVNGIPGELRGLPSRATAVPFSVREMPVAFCVCQLRVTVPPCVTVCGVTEIVAVGLADVPVGFGVVEGFELGFDVG
jgi:hypothetical protein